VSEDTKQFPSVGDVVLHRPTGTVGVLNAINDGPGPTTIELEEGHTFVAVPERFEVLSPVEAGFWRVTCQGISAATTELARQAVGVGMPIPRFVLLATSAYRSQLRALEVGR